MGLPLRYRWGLPLALAALPLRPFFRGPWGRLGGVLVPGDVIQLEGPPVGSEPPAAPPPPSGLNKPGRVLWERFTTQTVDREVRGELHRFRFELDPRELTLLEAACRQADDVARLERHLRKSGLTTSGSMGQTRLAAAVAEVRQGRLALQRLVDALPVAPSEDDAPAVTGASRRAQKAAESRWAREGRR